MVVLPVGTRNYILEKQLNQLHLFILLIFFVSMFSFIFECQSMQHDYIAFFLSLCNGGCSRVGTADALSAQLLEFCPVCKSI